MIFISHNYNDKVVIEPIAERLAEIFGQENVFYDSWSIQPGQGIIDKMNEGLSNATHFFYFVSENSIKSNMVKLEWQNAIFKASKGTCNVIPVRLDETPMPAILSQSLYIDLYSNGIETTITQIVNVVQGNSTYKSSSQKFSNLTYTLTMIEPKKFEIKIFASHFLEPIPDFLILIKNNKNELNFTLPSESMFIGGFQSNLVLDNGNTVNAHLIKSNTPITPKHPLVISVQIIHGEEFIFLEVMHKIDEERYASIPRRNS